MNENRDVKYIGSLPEGYDYYMITVGDIIRLIGICVDKEPIFLEVIDDKIINFTPRIQYER